MKNFVQLRLIAVIVFAVLFIGSAFAQDEKLVVYVYDKGRVDPATNASPELPVVNAIKDALGYEVAMFPTIGIENATPEQLDSLKNADLIIIGRAIGSWNWTEAGRNIWNTIETPVISTNAFAIRPNQLNWFFGSEVYGGGADQELLGTVMFPEDTIFDGVELDENNQFVVWTGNWTAIKLDPAFPGNGQLMIQALANEGAEIHVIMGRFEAGEPFYEGAPSPAGPRTYMGLGADGGDPQVYNYWGWSEGAAQIFLEEVERLANYVGEGTNVEPTEALSARVYPNPASSNLVVRMNNLQKAELWDLTGKLIYTVSGNGAEANFEISGINEGIYLVKAIDSNNNTVVRRVVKK